MDKHAVWSKIAEPSKSAWHWSAETITNTLDAVSPAFGPFAERWDEEADRRTQMRTTENLKALIASQREHNAAGSTARQAKAQRRLARRQSKNPLSAVRRAAAAADRAADKHKVAARDDVKAAKKNYPNTLKTQAVKAHSAHSVVSVLASYLMTKQPDWSVALDDDWTLWPAGASAALIVLNVVGLALGRREVTVTFEDELSAEERRLMERLHPTYWVPNAEDRGLTGTVTEFPEITPAGIVCGVRLDGKWSAKALSSQADAVRALLGMKSDTRMQITRGTHGDRALIVIRTRSASDGVSMIWTPDHTGIGVDETTGEFVDVPMAGTHKLIAGVTNMGKSVSWRPWMMQAVADPLWAGILLDPKRLEARLWHGKIRTEGHQRGSNEEIRQAIYDAIRELVAEMQHRQEIADVTQWVPTPEYPNLLTVIEEGRQILQMAKDKRWADILDLIDDLYTLARATGIWIIWATQYPSRTNGGVTAMVSENSLTVMSLTVDSPVSDRVVYGENAAESGWEPSKLESIPGRALVKHKGRKPNPVRIWHVTDAVVNLLPQADPWIGPWIEKETAAPAAQAPAPVPAPANWWEKDADRPALRLVKDGGLPAVPAQPAAPAADSTDARVLVTLQKLRPPVRQKDIVDASGLPKGTVSKSVKRLVDGGHLVREDDGTVRVAAPGEVSA